MIGVLVLHGPWEIVRFALGSIVVYWTLIEAIIATLHEWDDAHRPPPLTDPPSHVRIIHPPFNWEYDDPSLGVPWTVS